MSEKEMTLRMRIVAQGEEGRRMFKQLNQDLVSFQKNQKELWGGIGGAAALPFKAIGMAGGVIFAPLKLAAEAAGTLTGGLIALGSAALYAASEDEKLQSRLAAVSGTAIQGARAMEVLEAMSRHSSFKTEDLGEAAILMKNYGIDSQRALRAVASAAKVAGVGVGDLALQTMALQSRGMKRFGIELDDTKENPVIKFRDRMGQIRKIVTKDADEARRKLVDVFSLKFGTDIFPKTFSGFVSMLKNNIDQAFANFGEGLLKPAKRFINYISGGLADAIENGDLEKWGKMAGEWLDGVVTKFMAFVDTLKQAFEYIPTLLKDGANGLIQVISSTLKGIGETMGVALIEYLKASTDIFFALGRVIGDAIKQTLLSMDVPGMGKARKTAFENALTRMSPEQAEKLGVPRNLAGKAPADGPGIEPDIFIEMNQKAIEEFLSTHSREQIAKIASFDAGADMADAFKTAGAAMKKARDTIAESARQSFSGVDNAFKNSTGFDATAAYRSNISRRITEADQLGKESVTARFTEMVSDPNNPTYRLPYEHEETRQAKAGVYKVGNKIPGGGVIIKIEKLNINSSNAGRVQHEVITSAMKGYTPGYCM